MNENLRILVVDDDPALLSSVASVLERDGYEVLQASTGKDALDIVMQARPVLVLLDVVLPDLSGLEVCARIKADPSLGGTLVVLLSGVDTSSDAQVAGLDRGADGYVVKPIGARELIARVKSMVRIREAEEVLRASEERYRSYVEVTGQLAWTTNVDGQVVEDLPALLRFTGQTKEEVKGLGWVSALHPDDVEQTMQVWTKAVATKTAYEVEYRIRRYDGIYRHFLARGVPVLERDGSVREWVGTCIDITERKQAEETLRQAHEELEQRVAERTAELSTANELLKQEITDHGLAEQALQLERDKLKLILDTINDGVHIVNRCYQIEYVNPVIEKEFGPVKGRKCYEYFHDTKEVCSWCKSPQVFEGESMDSEWHSVRTGRTFDVHEMPIVNTDGSISKLKLMHDITQRKQSEETLRNALSEINELKDRIEAENIYIRQEISMGKQFSHIVGQSNALKYVLYRAEQVAPADTTVLILGETGTGKELIAAAIHQMSPRKDRVMVTVNCAALPPNLIESELFGREKGAFTGADARRVGRFEIASGSTICLDEIGELPLEVQGKLLRVIQNGEFQRLGSPHTVKVNVRIVATTNRNLEEEVRKGRFRKDLYYRLNVFPITLPPLRQRKEDIPLLVQAFLERFNRQLGKEITTVPKETMRALQEYEWPGNIRELENIMERAVILCPGPVFRLADHLEDLPCSSSPDSKTMEEAERDHILRTLSETRWRINGKNGAAAILGLNPSTLRARMQKLGIQRPDMKTPE